MLSGLIAVQLFGPLLNGRQSRSSSALHAETQAPLSALTWDTASIGRAHLFGSSTPTAERESESEVMKLSGVIATRTATEGFAIVAIGEGRAGFYIAGHALPDGSTLARVYKDHVVLERSGIARELYLPKQLKATGQALALANQSEGDDAETSSARAAREFQDRVLLGAVPRSAGAVRMLRPEAVVSAGKLHGYQLYPADPEKYGVHSGDELIAINGKDFKDPQQAAALLQGLESSQLQQVELTLVHAGETYQVALETQLLRRH